MKNFLLTLATILVSLNVLAEGASEHHCTLQVSLDNGSSFQIVDGKRLQASQIEALKNEAANSSAGRSSEISIAAFLGNKYSLQIQNGFFALITTNDRGTSTVLSRNLSLILETKEKMDSNMMIQNLSCMVPINE